MNAARTEAPQSPLRVGDPLLDAWTRHLVTHPAHTRDAYLRDVRALQSLAGGEPLAGLSSKELRRHLATLHARGLSGRSLARMLSAWRAFYRFAIERDPTLKDNPGAGLKAPKSPRRLPSALSPDEAVQLVAIDIFVRLVGLVDRAGPAHYGGHTQALAEQAPFAAEAHFDPFMLARQSSHQRHDLRVGRCI